MRNAELIQAELKLSEAYAQMAQMSAALANYQFREAQANSQRLAAELREAATAVDQANAVNDTPVDDRGHLSGIPIQ